MNEKIHESREYPSLANAIALLDLGVLSDLTGENEDNSDLHPVFAMGTRPDMAAGLHGFVFTPYFPSLKELNDFCWIHAHQIENIASALMNDAPYPDYGWWDK